MEIKRLIKNTVVYFLLAIGYLLLYRNDVEKWIYDIDEDAPKSKVDFIYQQF